MQQSVEIGQLVAALIKAQQEFDPIIKSKNNPFFKSKYADLQAVVEATQPTLIANGLVITQFPVSDEKGVGVLSILAHISGRFISESVTLPLGKNDAQTGVAAVTYARRTAWLGIIGVAAEDDDGNTAAGRDSEMKQSTIKTKPVKVPTAIYKSDSVALPPKAEIPADLPKSEVAFTMPSNDGDVLPDENQMADYGERIKALGFQLKSAGLNDKGLPASRKIVAFLLRGAGVADPNQISTKQFDTFLEFASSANHKSLAGLVEAGYK